MNFINPFQCGLMYKPVRKIPLQLGLSLGFFWDAFNINLSQTGIHINPFIHKPLSAAFIFGPYSSGVENSPFQRDLYLNLLL